MYSGSNLDTGTKSTSPKQKKVDTLKKRQLSNLERSEEHTSELQSRE